MSLILWGPVVGMLWLKGDVLGWRDEKGGLWLVLISSSTRWESLTRETSKHFCERFFQRDVAEDGKSTLLMGSIIFVEFSDWRKGVMQWLESFPPALLPCLPSLSFSPLLFLLLLSLPLLSLNPPSSLSSSPKCRDTLILTTLHSYHATLAIFPFIQSGF